MSEARSRLSQKDGNATVGKPEKVKLKKNVGLITGISYVVGSMIGAGIFFTPRGVLKETGSIGLSLIIWMLGGVISILGSLTYSELGTMIPKSGAEYPYIMAGLGNIIAYMFAWTKSMILVPTDIAISSLTIGEYTSTFFGYCGLVVLPPKLIAALVIVSFAIISAYSTKRPAYLQVVFAGANLVLISIIIVGGFVWIILGKGHLPSFDESFKGSTTSVSKIALGFYDALWCYDGWNMLHYATEELRQPYKNLPRASLIGVFLVMIVYQLTNISYIIVLGKGGILKASTVVVNWGHEVLGQDAGRFMPIFVIISTFGAVNGATFAGVRTMYAAAREQQFPEVLSYVSCRYYTPLPCVIFTSILALAYLIPGDIWSLINFFSFAVWTFSALTALSFFVLRYKMKDAHRPIKIHISIPIVFFIASTYLVIAPIIQNPSIEFLYSFLCMIGGLVFYVPLVHFKIQRGFFDNCTKSIQKWLEIVPSPYEFDVQ